MKLSSFGSEKIWLTDVMFCGPATAALPLAWTEPTMNAPAVSVRLPPTVPPPLKLNTGAKVAPFDSLKTPRLMPVVWFGPVVTGVMLPVTGSKLSTWKPLVTLALTGLVGFGLTGTILVAEADHWLPPSAVKVSVTVYLLPCESNTVLLIWRVVPATSVEGRLALTLTTLVDLAGVVSATLLWK